MGDLILELAEFAAGAQAFWPVLGLGAGLLLLVAIARKVRKALLKFLSWATVILGFVNQIGASLQRYAGELLEATKGKGMRLGVLEVSLSPEWLIDISGWFGWALMAFGIVGLLILHFRRKRRRREDGR